METIQELEKIPALYEKLSSDAAIKEATYKNLEEQKKSIFSGIKNRAKREQSNLPESALERIAYASEEYQIFIDGLCKARHDYLVSKAALNALDIKVDVLRSINTTNNAKIKLL